MKKTGAQILIDTLLYEGVDVAFGIPGGVVIPIFDVLYEAPMKFILCAHEQGAVHAADGYARASGKVGVCIATSGPGATNLVTGIATAYMDSSPIVAITGQVKTNLIGNHGIINLIGTHLGDYPAVTTAHFRGQPLFVKQPQVIPDTPFR